MKTLEVHLRDVETGATGVRTETYPDDYPDDAINYHWTDGNYGCDCNRRDFLYGGDVHRESLCGHDKIVVDSAVIKETGVVIIDGEGGDET